MILQFHLGQNAELDTYEEYVLFWGGGVNIIKEYRLLSILKTLPIHRKKRGKKCTSNISSSYVSTVAL